MTDASIFNIYIQSPALSSVFPFGISGPLGPPPLPANNPAQGHVAWCYPPPLPSFPPSLPSLFHLTQTDPTSSQEGRACGAVERGGIPALSPCRAAHTHTYMDLSAVASCSTSDQAASEHALTCWYCCLESSGGEQVQTWSQTAGRRRRTSAEGICVNRDQHSPGRGYFSVGLSVLPCLRLRGMSQCSSHQGQLFALRWTWHFVKFLLSPSCSLICSGTFASIGCVNCTCLQRVGL